MSLSVPGIDFAWGNPPYAAAQKAGIKFVCRYLSHDPKKDLTLTELREWRKRGIQVVVVWETGAQRALAGWSGGHSDGLEVKARLSALGINVPVYFACDWDVTEAQKPVVAKYLEGAASVLTKSGVGVYGGYWVVKYMAEHDACNWFWQTYAWSGGFVWGLKILLAKPFGRVKHPVAHIYQWRNGVRLGGVSCDLNKARGDIPYGSTRVVTVPARKPPKRKLGHALQVKVWHRQLALTERQLAQRQREVAALTSRISKLKRLTHAR